MYVPGHFEPPGTEQLFDLIRARSLSTLITSGPDGINANHIPLLLDTEGSDYGVLRGHVARANPLWQELAQGREVLAIFHGPEAYITPSWYATKAESGRVVPTWNYAVAHAYGLPRTHQDAGWLQAHLAELVDAHEAGFDSPWALADAPSDYTDKLLTAIVGIEIEITRLTGKWKMSQNQPASNRVGVASGLRGCGQGAAADLVAEPGRWPGKQR